LKSMLIGLVAAASTALILAGTRAHGQEVKVGVQLPYTGVGAENAQQIDRGLQLYLKLNADKVKPYTIKLVKRDSKDLGGANARVAVQELLTQDNVDILTGWYDSPSAIASAPLVNAGKKLAVILNAGAAHIPNLSPYYVRVSFSNWHAGFSMGEAAAKMLQAKTAVVGYSDFAGGKDSLAAFKHGFAARSASKDARERAYGGGTVIDEIPMGGTAAVPDFTPFFQRAKDKKPDVFYVFVPGGDFALAAVRTYHALGRRPGSSSSAPARSARTASCKRWERPRPVSSPRTTTMPISATRRTSASSRRGRRNTVPTRFQTSSPSAAMTAWRPSCVRFTQQTAKATQTRRLRRSGAGRTTARAGRSQSIRLRATWS
jgi:ABC-type branched-subunit amino acid transport system substrate-binding protein